MRSDPKVRTIADAARDALEFLGRPATPKEIYDAMRSLGLYEFNTPVPVHVLRTQMRRMTAGVARVDSQSDKLFVLVGDEVYDLMSRQPPKKKPVLGMRRIHRATDKTRIIEQMVSEELGVFREIWRVLTFAAFLGLRRGRRVPLEQVDMGKGIDQSSFGNCPSWPGLLYAISLVESGTTDAFSASEEAEQKRIQAFEEYANGGLAIIQEELGTRGLRVDSLMSLIVRNTGASQIARPDLDVTL